jgi:hypothetical protein
MTSMHIQGTQKDVDLANADMPIGTRVRYYPGPRSMGYRECEIRYEFHLNINGLLVGWVTGQAGYVSAGHIEKVEAEVAH